MDYYNIGGCWLSHGNLFGELLSSRIFVGGEHGRMGRIHPVPGMNNAVGNGRENPPFLCSTVYPFKVLEISQTLEKSFKFQRTHSHVIATSTAA